MLSTKKFFDLNYGHKYFYDNWNKYYPDFPPHILVSAWYELEPNIRWHYDSANSAKKILSDYFIEMAEFAVNNDLNGVYKFFMRLGGIKRVLGLAPQLNSAYLNCVNGKVLVNKDNYYRAEVNCPSFARDWHMYGQKGGFMAIIKLFGYELIAFNILAEEEYINSDLQFSKIIFELIYK